jgi:hypothetical protein
VDIYKTGNLLLNSARLASRREQAGKWEDVSLGLTLFFISFMGWTCHPSSCEHQRCYFMVVIFYVVCVVCLCGSQRRLACGGERLELPSFCPLSRPIEGERLSKELISCFDICLEALLTSSQENDHLDVETIQGRGQGHAGPQPSTIHPGLDGRAWHAFLHTCRCPELRLLVSNPTIVEETSWFTRKATNGPRISSVMCRGTGGPMQPCFEAA